MVKFSAGQIRSPDRYYENIFAMYFKMLILKFKFYKKQRSAFCIILDLVVRLLKNTFLCVSSLKPRLFFVLHTNVEGEVSKMCAKHIF